MALTKIGKEGVTGISNSSNATAITIDSSENVGVGTASPTKKVSTSIGLNDTDGYVLEYSGEAKAGLLVVPATGEVRMGAINSSGIYFPTFYSNNSEAMRINDDGNVIINGTASGIPGAIGDGLLHINRQSQTANSIIVENVPQNYTALAVKRSGTAGVIYAGYFLNDAKSNVGSITVSNTATAFVTSSDYRLKTNVNYNWDATSRLKQIKPARFEWIADGDDAVPVDGFLAHEVQTIVPEAITGTHNEVDDDGNPVYQGIDQAKLVPLLCKTILELEARITALETA